MPAAFSQQLEINVSLDSYDGAYAPHKAAAVWIQTPEGEMIRTVALWSDAFCGMLKHWGGVAEDLDSIDAVTAATIDSNGPIRATWDCKNYKGERVPYGTYEFWVDFSENEYWWQIFDSTEQYSGYANWGTITIDSMEKKIDGDSSILFIYDFSAHYLPGTAVKKDTPSKGKSIVQHLNYDSHKKQVIIRTRHADTYPCQVSVVTVKGELVKQFMAFTPQIRWDCKSQQGTYVPAGIYFITLLTTATDKSSSPSTIKCLLAH